MNQSANESAPMQSLVQRYLAFGFHLGATHASNLKHPVGGMTRCTADLEEILSWLAEEPGGGLFASLKPSELVHVDIDVRPQGNGYDDLARLEARYGLLPSALIYTSPSGGEGRLLRLPGGVEGVRYAREGLVEFRFTGAVVLPPTPGYVWKAGFG